MSRTTRLFELLGLLRAHRLPVSAAALASELGVSQRSVYRDIDTLRALGAPLEGQAGVGYYLKPGFFLPPLAFSQEELDAVMLGLDWVRQRADPALATCGESALTKILSARKHGAGTDMAPPAILTAASTSERTDHPQTAVLRDAIRRQCKLAIGYVDAQNAPSERIVWPIALVYFDEVRVLAAWCERRVAFRHFRVDRLHVQALLEERYPQSRQALVKQWRQQDRDWRSLLTVSGTTQR
ncbi:helix-turn-helix transcriptional regulator [Xanthomonas prunicola]|jgi:predicted DNA-binding transcriptional regulator YafY|uniref:Transcriptional regulator n=1 Tax=Xanthomonas prunicola TaxID=2053930 RepID=A0A2N3REB3_9XANT|nr:YafY family protein [Xanthomonas prunicola]PKV10821.1 transcriptional regulator [Xanthomonas prunicola]PKV15115.1 transcriptional regulator [Xanthomonas prunicola]PKV19708.1 transcriptional regulator [Xanthomonas prunicola]